LVDLVVGVVVARLLKKFLLGGEFLDDMLDLIRGRISQIFAGRRLGSCGIRRREFAQRLRNFLIHVRRFGVGTRCIGGWRLLGSSRSRGGSTCRGSLTCSRRQRRGSAHDDCLRSRCRGGCGGGLGDALLVALGCSWGTSQQPLDPFLEHAEVTRLPFKSGVNAAVPSDQHGGGQTRYSPIKPSRVIIAHGDGVVYVAMLVIGLHCLLAISYRNPDNSQPFAVVLVLKSD